MRAALLAFLIVASAESALAQTRRCPAAEYLPQLTIDTVQDPAVPVIDTWQVFFDRVPLSDVQLAQLAGDDTLIDKTRREIKRRGSWVYVGTLLAATGTAISSVGWLLYGQGKQPATITLPLAIGGIVLGAAGMLTITESVQTPLEPVLAPTPEHRLTRAEVRDLVARVNKRLYEEICEASQAADAGLPPPRAVTTHGAGAAAASAIEPD